MEYDLVGRGLQRGVWTVSERPIIIFIIIIEQEY